MKMIVSVLKVKKMAKRKRKSVMLNAGVKNLLDGVKDESKSYNELIEYLVQSLDFKVEPRGAIKAEIQLKKWLYEGHERRITASELYKWSGVNYKLCKEVTELYEDDIKEHNKNL